MKMFLSICVFSLMSLIGTAQSASIQFFEGTFEEALSKAKAENKVIFMDAYTTWCGPCKWMAKNTFTDADVATYFNDNFINVKMDMERGEGPGLAKKYRVMAYPTLLFINGEGEIVHKKMGAQPAEAFLDIGKQVSAKL